ncbi:SCO7613 C-terminal domain-containing membrane protein [Diaminobutyricimonas aerilata]|uniref:SCO7613 C-terminal domain-containing membrane protein n=1 Tax=Diaminobutyricimonas aerilata TaxID=1162967 RepID=UPI0012FD0600|nr:hypothetical protein [Diaminobutyricimonas aerilata]
MLLLIAGISLLSIAAIVFTVLALFTFGVVGRSIVIAAVTFTAIAVATLLRRRGLDATGEGIAVFAVVLVLLDVWAVRANDLFGAAGAESTLYWGAGLTVVTVGAAVWSRAARLRTPLVAAALLVTPGVGLLTAGVAAELPDTTRAFAASLVASLVALLIPLAVLAERRPAVFERYVVLVGAALAGTGALATGALVGDRAWEVGVALGVAAVLWAAVAFRALRDDTPPRIRPHLFAVGAAVALAAIAPLMATRVEDPEPFLAIAPLATAAVALGADVASARAGRARSALTAAAIAAGVLAALILLVPFGVAVIRTLVVLAEAVVGAWTVEPVQVVVDTDPTLPWSIAGLAAVVGLLVAARRLGGHLRPLGIVFAASAVVVVFAVTAVPVPLVRTALWLGIALAAMAALRSAAVRGRPALALTLAVTAPVASLFGYLTGWAADGTWIATGLIVIALLVLARSTPGAGVIARTTAVALSVGVATGLAIGLAAAAVAAPQPALTLDGHRFVTVLAVVVLLTAAVLPRIPALERRALFWSGLVIGLPAFAALAAALNAGATPELLLEPLSSLVVGSALVVALALWSAAPSLRPLRPERVAAAVATGPALFLALDALARLTGIHAVAALSVPVVAALLVAAAALARAVRTDPGVPRIAGEAGALVVGFPAVATALGRGDDSGWLVLVLAAVAVLIAAVDRDGLFGSSSNRRHLGWLALALAIGGLWWRLGGDGVDALEAYLLPVTGALLAVAALLWRARRSGRAAELVPPSLTLAALLVSVVPLALDAFDGGSLRIVVIAAVCAIGAILASAFRPSTGARPYLDAVVAAGVLGITIAGVGRALWTSRHGSTGPEPDLWAIAVVAALAIVAALQSHGTPSPARARVASALVLAAIAAALLVELPLLDDGTLGGLRALALIAVLGLVHLAGLAAPRPPIDRVVGWVALGGSGATAVAGVAVAALEPVEWGSVPLALVLLAGGTIVMTRDPRARSWPWYGPGVAVLLIPSLVATLWDRPLWRLVALGVAGVAVVVIGVVRRLQAPFLIGIAVTLVHAIATFAPQIRAVYETVPPWLWLALGGILLTVLAARYEQRRKNVRDAIRGISALR